MARDTEILGGGRPFPETSWSLIADCAGGADPVALDALFRRYWGPVFLYSLRYWSKGDVEEAKDATQAFFLAFLEKDFLASVDAGRGRFRTFVCAALKNFLRNRRRDERAAQRRPEGGLLSLEAMVEDDRRFDVAADPDRAFDDDWRRATIAAALDSVRKGLASDPAQAGLVDAFVERHLEATASGPPDYDAIARRLGLSYHQVKNGLHRVRKAFAAALRREVGDQVTNPRDLAGEAAAYGLDVEEPA